MIDLIVALIIIGALLYICQLLPIDAIIKKVITVVVVIAAVVYVLRHLSVLGL